MRDFCQSVDSLCNYHIQASESKDIIKVFHVTPVV